METKAIRVFYRKSDNKIVWIYSLEGPGLFPTTIKEDLALMPINKPDGKTPLGGLPEDYACIEVIDTTAIVAYFASDTNQVINGEVHIGDPRPPPEPDPDTLRVQEILATSPDTITMPEIWELLRIIGRRLGYLT